MLVDHSLHEQKLPEEIPYKHLLTAVTIRLENLFPQSKKIRVLARLWWQRKRLVMNSSINFEAAILL